jgi:Transposase DDE domain
MDTHEAVIVDVEATPARMSKEIASTRTMLERTDRRLALTPERVAADKAYGSGELLGWLVAREIEPHIPVRDRSERTDGALARAAFAYDAERNVYVCPTGKTLKTTGRVIDGTIYYRSRKADCAACAMKPACCPNGLRRRIPRDVHEDARDRVRALAGTPSFARSQRERRKIELLFAHLKRQLGLERLRLRGLSGARDEFLLAATDQNLRRLARFVAPAPAPSPG